MVLSVEVKFRYQRASFDSSATDGNESLLARLEELTWDFASGREPLSEMLFVSAVLAMRALAVLCKLLKLKEMEATGVELFSVLTARKLLILRKARRAKKAPLPNPLYVYCTKIFSN